MGVDSSGLVGDTSSASHLVGFRVSPFSSAKLLTLSICSCNVARELLIVCMSSAWMNAPAKVSPTNGPSPLLCRDFKRGFMISKKRTGDRTEPWRTPRSRVSNEDREPLTFTLPFGKEYQHRSSLQALPLMPASYSHFRRTGYWMGFNAFCRS